MSRLYLAMRSPRAGAPLLIWPHPVPTARSAMNVSSVSPDRCETIWAQPASRQIRMAYSVSVTVSTLVGLDQRGVGDLAADRLADDRRVGHQDVVADELDRVPESGGQVLPAVPVGLGQAVLDAPHREALGHLCVALPPRSDSSEPSVQATVVLAGIMSSPADPSARPSAGHPRIGPRPPARPGEAFGPLLDGAEHFLLHHSRARLDERVRELVPNRQTKKSKRFRLISRVCPLAGRNSNDHT